MDQQPHITVPPMSAPAFVMTAGEILWIVDVGGGQPGDLVAFNRHDLSQRFSQSRTRVENATCRPTVGHRLWTGGLTPEVMFTIVADSAGNHDLTYPACSRFALGKRFGLSRDGCHENLAASLAGWGVRAGDIPDPLNLFFTVEIGPGGGLRIGKHSSRPGDSIVLRAEMDCLVAVSTCPAPLKEKSNTGYRIEVQPSGTTVPDTRTEDMA